MDDLVRSVRPRSTARGARTAVLNLVPGCGTGTQLPVLQSNVLFF